MKKGLVSVILPAYNAERFIKESIDSILNQTYSNFELIILNDGSTDKTDKIILSYNDPRIVYVKNETNLKLIKTLNKGIDLAKGEYIARMDADDISLPKRLEKEVLFMEQHPDIGVVSCYPNNMSSKGHYLCHSSYFSTTEYFSHKFVCMFEPPILHPGVLFRKEVIKEHKYMDSPEFYHIEAYELWVRLINKGIKTAMIPEFLLNYRDNESSICHIYSETQWERQLKLSKTTIQNTLNYECNNNILLNIIQKRVSCVTQLPEVFNVLDKIYELYQIKYPQLSSEVKREICNWVKQRKLSIILASAKESPQKLKYLFFFLRNIGLCLNTQNIYYIKNRIIRQINERK